MKNLRFALAVTMLASAASLLAADKPMEKPMDKGMDKAHAGAMAAGAAGSHSGILVDTKCYTADHKNTANKHGNMDGCGTACAKMGIPVGLLMDGKLVVLAAPAPNLAPYIGEKATVVGEMKDGMLVPSKVTVTGADGKTTDVKLEGMM